MHAITGINVNFEEKMLMKKLRVKFWNKKLLKIHTRKYPRVILFQFLWGVKYGMESMVSTVQKKFYDLG